MAQVPLSTWQKWLSEAIAKVRAQKQRTSAERVTTALRPQHSEVTLDLVVKNLERLVEDGHFLRVSNNGSISYKDSSQGLRTLTVGKGDDLTKVGFFNGSTKKLPLAQLSVYSV
jgi:histone acetyltransferase MYST4